MITCFGTSHPWIQQLLPEKMFWFSALTFLWNKAKDNNNKFKHEINYFVTAIFMFNSKIKNNNQVQSWASFLGLCSNMKQLPFHRFLAQLCRNNKKIGGNHRSKSKATTTTDICNTMGDCECKPCQKIFYIKTTCSQSSSYGKDISLFYA